MVEGIPLRLNESYVKSRKAEEFLGLARPATNLETDGQTMKRSEGLPLFLHVLVKVFGSVNANVEEHLRKAIGLLMSESTGKCRGMCVRQIPAAARWPRVCRRPA